MGVRSLRPTWFEDETVAKTTAEPVHGLRLIIKEDVLPISDCPKFEATAEVAKRGLLAPETWHCNRPYINLKTMIFFSSGMADVALWLGPYMSINCQNYICTRTQKVHKCRQIKSHQTTHKTHNQDDPQIPQPDLRFVKKNSKPDRQRGKSPNNKTHKKDLPRDTADFTTVSHSKTCIN